MNIRSLITVLGLTAVLFFVNQYFSNQRQQEYAEELRLKETAQVEQISSEKQKVISIK